MSFHFRPALKAEAKPLIGLYSESGKGKTHSALLLACGFVNGDMSKVGMIETESGRGEAYASDPVVGGYRVLSIREDFSPKRYGEAITAAETAGLQVLIIDSASHEWEGAGGVLGMAAKNQADGKKGVLVWQQPKMQHSSEFMLRLMQTPIPLVIVCMRAKYPMQQITPAHVAAWRAAGGRGKPPEVGEWMRSTTLEPKQADDILYEMFIHGWIDDEHRFHGTKYTLEELRKVIVDGEPINVDSGRKLAAWASGGQPKAAAQAPATERPGVTAVDPPATADMPPPDAAAPDEPDFLTEGADVDTETGEIITRTSRSYPFMHPGKPDAQATLGSADEWFKEWTRMCDMIAKSTRLSPPTKEGKIRELKKVNDETIKSIGGVFPAKIQGDMATRVTTLKAEAAAAENERRVPS